MAIKDKEIKKIIDTGINDLFEEIKKGKSDRLVNYLKFISNFCNYSYFNTFLIYFQNPKATRVAGFNKWKSLGYMIKKGSKAMSIVAPQKYTYILGHNGRRIFYRNMTKAQRADKDNHISGLKFTPVAVFDISQCTGRDKGKENYFFQLGDSHKDKYYNLKKVIENDGITVEEKDTGITEGSSLGGKILIKNSNNFNNKLLTLIHEYGHEILHQGSENKELARGKKECQAEAVSFIVGRYFGIDNPFSGDYILQWGGTRDKLKENIEKVLEASNIIINNIEKENWKAKDNAHVRAAVKKDKVYSSVGFDR